MSYWLPLDRNKTATSAVVGRFNRSRSTRTSLIRMARPSLVDTSATESTGIDWEPRACGGDKLVIAAGANLPAIAGYALGLVGFLAFLLQLLLRWRGGEYARLLLCAVLASCFWEASGLAFLVWESPWAWLSYQLADGIRVSAWLGFVVSLLLTSTPKKSDSRRYASPGLIVLLVGAAAIGLWSWLAPLPLPGTNVSATGESSVGLGLWLAVSILGLVVTEQLFRNTAESSRWAIKPLCVGLGGAFGFDLFLYSDGLLLRHLDYGIWSAQGFAQALVIPFIMVAVARNRHWTIDIAISRRAVFHSTSILLSGIYLLVVAGAGYYVRYVGGSWGRIVQAAFLFAALMVLTALFSSGTVRAKLKVFVNKHFFPYRYDYREEWLRVTDLLSTTTPGMELRERCIRALAELVESPAGALWLKKGEQIVQSGRWNMPHVVETEPVSGELSKVSSRHQMDGQHSRAKRSGPTPTQAFRRPLGSRSCPLRGSSCLSSRVLI